MSNVGMSNERCQIHLSNYPMTCGINKKSRSHRSAADGVVAHKQMLQNAFRGVTPERPPRPPLFGTGPFFWWRVHPSLARRGMCSPVIRSSFYDRRYSSFDIESVVTRCFHSSTDSCRDSLTNLASGRTYFVIKKSYKLKR